VNDREVEKLLRAHLQASRELLALHKPDYSEETAEPVLRANLRIVEEMRRLEQTGMLEDPDRRSLRDHIDVSRRLIRLKAREFRFAYVDPEDGEGGSPIFARILPVPSSLTGRSANSAKLDD
jgi:hypothetical protein